MPIKKRRLAQKTFVTDDLDDTKILQNEKNLLQLEMMKLSVKKLKRELQIMDETVSLKNEKIQKEIENLEVEKYKNLLQVRLLEKQLNLQNYAFTVPQELLRYSNFTQIYLI